MPFSQTDGFLARGADAPADGLLREFGPCLLLAEGVATSLAVHSASEAVAGEGDAQTVTEGEAISVAFLAGISGLAETSTVTTIAAPLGLATAITEAAGFASVAAVSGLDAIRDVDGIVVTNTPHTGREVITDSTTNTSGALPSGIEVFTDSGVHTSLALHDGTITGFAELGTLLSAALPAGTETFTDAGQQLSVAAIGGTTVGFSEIGALLSAAIPSGAEAFSVSGQQLSAALVEGAVTEISEFGTLLSAALLNGTEVITERNGLITIALLTGVPTVVDLVPVPAPDPILDSGNVVTLAILDGLISAFGEQGDLETLATLLAQEGWADAGILTSRGDLGSLEVITERETLTSLAALEGSIVLIGGEDMTDSGLIVSNAILLGEQAVPTVFITVRRGPGRVPVRRGFHDPTWYPDHYRVHR